MYIERQTVEPRREYEKEVRKCSVCFRELFDDEKGKPFEINVNGKILFATNEIHCDSCIEIIREEYLNNENEN